MPCGGFNLGSVLQRGIAASRLIKIAARFACNAIDGISSFSACGDPLYLQGRCRDRLTLAAMKPMFQLPRFTGSSSAMISKPASPLTWLSASRSARFRMGAWGITVAVEERRCRLVPARIPRRSLAFSLPCVRSERDRWRAIAPHNSGRRIDVRPASPPRGGCDPRYQGLRWSSLQLRPTLSMRLLLPRITAESVENSAATAHRWRHNGRFGPVIRPPMGALRLDLDVQLRRYAGRRAMSLPASSSPSKSSATSAHLPAAIRSRRATSFGWRRLLRRRLKAVCRRLERAAYCIARSAGL